MALTYKTRQFYRRLFRVLLTLALVALVLLLCWVLWLRRFIIYTDAGVRLDFGLSQQWPLGQTGQATEPGSMPDIYFTQTTSTPPPTVDQQEDQFEGYYVTLESLQTELDTVLEQILALPAGTPVMLDVKGYRGTSYYTSAISASSDTFDMKVMDPFFEAVNASGVHAIARLPAFADFVFADANHSCGLKESRGVLWVDENRCYWLDPASEGTINHLIALCEELEGMGFDEVAFTHFCFPDTDQVVYEQDKAEVIQKAALALVNACANDFFAVSFITTDPAFSLPEGNCRLYLQDVAAANVQLVLEQMAPDVVKRTVFFTITKDTRFETCGVIRPLSMAQFAE